MFTLPNFLVVGAQRSGTTFLWGLLRQHPDIYMPEKKELHYFDEAPFNNDLLEGYAKQFSGANGASAVGEVTPEYIFFDWVPELIAKTLGHVRLVFVLRNPIERAYSHYWLMILTRREYLSFGQAIKRKPEQLQKEFLSWRNHSYVQRGIYFEQIKNYLQYFDRDQMLFVISEQFYKDPQRIMNEICSFLAVDHRFTFKTEQYRHHMKRPNHITLYRFLSGVRLWFKGRRGYWPVSKHVRQWQDNMEKQNNPYPPIKPAVRQYLQDLYQPYNDELSDFLNQDLSHWK